MINTLSDNFIWIKNTQYIKIKNHGLYNIIFGCFSNSKNINACLLINDKNVASI